MASPWVASGGWRHSLHHQVREPSLIVVTLTTLHSAWAGPAVVIQEAIFQDEADIDLSFRRAAWAAQTQADNARPPRPV